MMTRALTSQTAFTTRTPSGIEDYLMHLEPWQQSLPKDCLKDRTILVTGVQHMSIGGAAAHGLATHCGANVLLHSYSRKELDEVHAFMNRHGNDRKYPSYIVDFENPDSAWEMGTKILEEHGAPYAILNIAGVSEYPDITKFSPGSADTANLMRIMHINYLSPLRLIGSMITRMIEVNSDSSWLPRIICTSSIHSQRACCAGNSPYATSKNGQECIIRDLSCDQRFVGKLIAIALEFGWIDVIRHRADDQIFDAMTHAMKTMPTRSVPTASQAAVQYAKLLLPDAIGCHGTTILFDSGRSVICP